MRGCVYPIKIEMKKMKKFALFCKEETGFTFLEALLQLVVFMLLIFFFNLFMPLAQQFTTYFRAEHLRWEFFVTDLTNEFENVENIYITREKRLAYDLYKKRGSYRTYTVRNSANFTEVFRTVPNVGGYVLLLDRTKLMTFEKEGEEVLIVCEFQKSTQKYETRIVRDTRLRPKEDADETENDGATEEDEQDVDENKEDNET